MRIHIITNLFAPDELAGASLFTDLAKFLKDRGHDVRVTCTFSYYPAWKLRKEDDGIVVREETFHGIPVRRVSMHIPRVPTGKARILSDLSFFMALFRNARHPGWTPEVVLTAMPMLSQSLVQRFLYLGTGIPRLIVVQDFVVDAALELGIVRLPGFAGLLRSVQKWALRSASTLLTISPKMLEKLSGIVGSDRRTLCVPNWIHGSLQAEIDRQKTTPPKRAQLSMLYSGNVGIKQGLPDFIDMFDASRAIHEGWSLQIHGGGADVERLRAKLQGNKACQFGGVSSEAAYVNNLLSSTAVLVTQRPDVGANFLPSKILPALATGTPVLAVCDSASPLGREVIEGGFGVVIPPGNVEMLDKTLSQWRLEPKVLEEYGRKALNRALLYHRDQVIPIYESELRYLAQKVR